MPNTEGANRDCLTTPGYDCNVCDKRNTPRCVLNMLEDYVPHVSERMPIRPPDDLWSMFRRHADTDGLFDSKPTKVVVITGEENVHMLARELASFDRGRIVLLDVDMQYDFCSPQFEERPGGFKQFILPDMEIFRSAESILVLEDILNSLRGHVWDCRTEDLLGLMPFRIDRSVILLEQFRSSTNMQLGLFVPDCAALEELFHPTVLLPKKKRTETFECHEKPSYGGRGNIKNRHQSLDRMPRYRKAPRKGSI